uniref:G-protein coupled receptors family 1 profile domain-containing protein n=1 Tax=Ascaris lumbricoides TaxID=6252 RepID=A0A9J2PZJ7_ASCLU
MSELDQSICTEAKLIYTNQYFISLQVLVIILNISGIIQCTFITLFIASVQVFHINFRILFFNLSLALIIRSFLTLYRSSRYLVNIIRFTDSCELAAQEPFCFVQSVVNKTPLEASAFCFLAIGLERLLACLVYCRYEHCRLPIFGVFLALLPVCCLFSLLLSVTGRMQSLSSRFQLKENIHSCRSLAVASFTYMTTSLTDMSIVLVMSRFLDDDHIKDANLRQAIIKEFASLSMPIFVNIYSLIFICGHQYFKHRTISLLRCRRFDNKKSKSKIAPPMSIYSHMEIMAKIWDNERQMFNV